MYLKYVNTKIGDEDEDGEKERTLDGETSIPPKHIELLRMPTDETYQVTQYVYGVVMLITTIFFGLTIRWRNENAIKYSQKKILFVILWGIIVMEVRNCEERSDELRMRQFHSLFDCASSPSLDIDATITVTQF